MLQERQNMTNKFQLILTFLLLVTATPTLSIEPVSMLASWVGGKLLNMGLQKAKEQLEAPVREFFNESIYQLKSWDARRKRDKELSQEHEKFKNKAKEDRRENIDTFNQRIQEIGSLADPETKIVAAFLKKQDDEFNKLLLEFDTKYKKELEILNTQADLSAVKRYRQEQAFQKKQSLEFETLKNRHKSLCQDLKSLHYVVAAEYEQIVAKQIDEQDKMTENHTSMFGKLQQEHQKQDEEENTKLQNLKDNLLAVQKKELKTFLKNENENRTYFIDTLKANREKRITSQIIVGAVFLVALIAKGIYSA